MWEGTGNVRDGRQLPHTTRRYLRAEQPPGSPVPPLHRVPPAFVPLLLRFASPLLLIGVVVTVLVGQGFWAAPPGTNPNAVQQPTDTVPLVASPPDARDLGNGIDSREDPAIDSVSLTTLPRNVDSSPAFTGYFSRPSSIITTVPQRVSIVPARRDDTLSTIARRTGASPAALMYANSINDPERPLTTGQTIRVPPAGTMLHRIKDSDTLEGIARAYQVKPEEIASYPGNNIQQTGDLVSGNFLIIPTSNLPVRDRVVFYQVREGDSLSKISSLYALNDPRTLQWANNLASANLVSPNQIVAVPPIDGIIHLIDQDDTKRTTEDAVTQIAKNFACTSIPCNDAPANDRVNKLAQDIFSFGPNHLTRGGKLVLGQEIIVPGGIPYIEPPPVVIPKNVTIDNPDIRAGGTSIVTTTVTTTTTSNTSTSSTRSSGTIAARTTATDDYGPAGSSAIARAAQRHLGEYRRPDGVPWVGWCEMFVGNVASEAGSGHYRFATALIDARSGPLYRGRAPAGSLVFFDQSWNYAGHVGIAMGDGTMISTLSGGVVRSVYEGSAGYLGWRPFP